MGRQGILNILDYEHGFIKKNLYIANPIIDFKHFVLSYMIAMTMLVYNNENFIIMDGIGFFNHVWLLKFEYESEC